MQVEFWQNRTYTKRCGAQVLGGACGSNDNPTPHTVALVGTVAIGCWLASIEHMEPMRTTPTFFCVLLALLLTGACSVELQHDLDEQEANQIVALLFESGVSADKERAAAGEGWTVIVSRADHADAWTTMRAAGFPRRRLQDVEQLYTRSALLPSPGEEHTRLYVAKGVHLEESLRGLAGVKDARVHLNVPRTPKVLMPGVAQAKPKASVLVTKRLGTTFDPGDAAALVAGAVDGLEPSAVSVVVTHAPSSVPSTRAGFAPLGPFRVAPDTQSPLRALLVVLTIAVGGLASALLFLLVRLRRQRKSR